MPKSKKQRCQFFRYRFKGWLTASRSAINGFQFPEEMSWLNKGERARLNAIMTDLEVMIGYVDARTKEIMKGVS